MRRLTRLLLALGAGLTLLVVGATAVAADARSGPTSAVAILKPFEGQTALGFATLKDAGSGKTTVSLTMYGLNPKATHVNHIHKGSCANQGGVEFTLTELKADSRGMATAVTTVDKSVADLVNGDFYIQPHAINFPSPGITCGDILQHSSAVARLTAFENQTATGYAWLEDAGGGQTTVTLSLSGLDANGTHVNHIHKGSCASQGGVEFTLTELKADADGKATATTTVSKTVDELVNGDFYIQPHAVNFPAPGITCGDIVSHTSALATLKPFAGQTALGVAALEDAGLGKTKVTLTMQSLTPNGKHVTHIHTGSYAEQGGVKFWLTEREGAEATSRGQLKVTTTVDMSVDDLVAGDFYVQTHGVNFPAPGITCGDIVAGADGRIAVLRSVGDSGITASATATRMADGKSQIWLQASGLKAGVTYHSRLYDARASKDCRGGFVAPVSGTFTADSPTISYISDTDINGIYNLSVREGAPPAPGTVRACGEFEAPKEMAASVKPQGDSGISATAVAKHGPDGKTWITIWAQGLQSGKTYHSRLYSPRSVNCRGGLIRPVSGTFTSDMPMVTYVSDADVGSLFSISVREGVPPAPGTVRACGEFGPAVDTNALSFMELLDRDRDFNRQLKNRMEAFLRASVAGGRDGDGGPSANSQKPLARFRGMVWNSGLAHSS